MVVTCFYCGKTSLAGVRRSFHSFPTKRPAVYAIWVKNMNLESNFQSSKYVKLCSDHFSPECFKTEGTRMVLKEGSIPTILRTMRYQQCIYCKAEKKRLGKRTFHKFPFRNPQLLETWTSAAGLDPSLLNEADLLCSDHFERSCFYIYGGRPHLKTTTAVPTIFTLAHQLEGQIRSIKDASIERTVRITASASSEATTDVSDLDSQETTESLIIRPKACMRRWKNNNDTKAVPTISTFAQHHARRKSNNECVRKLARKTCRLDKATPDINATPDEAIVYIEVAPNSDATPDNEEISNTKADPGSIAYAEISATQSFVSTLKTRLRALKLDHPYEKTKKNVSSLKDIASNLTDDICRVCEGKAPLMNLFDDRNEHLLLMLRSVADISVDADDGLPKYICIQCDDVLERAYNFKLRCESTDRKLRLQQVNVSSDSSPALEQFQNGNIKTRNYEISDIATLDQDPNAEQKEEILVQRYASIDDMIVEEKSDHRLLEDPLQYVEEEEILSDQGIEFLVDSDGDGDIKVEDYLVEEEGEEDDASQECEDSNNYIIEHVAIEKIKELPPKESNDDANVHREPNMKPKCPKTRSKDNSFSCNSCPASFTRFSDLNAHKKTHGDKRFQCPKCSKWFSMLHKMKDHMLIHGDQIQLPCTMCSKKYTNRGNLVRHVRNFHNQERRFQCEICGLRFTQSSVLLRDHLAVHSEERNFGCNLCNKKFKLLHQLKVHRKCHITERNFGCNLCNKKYKTLYSLKVHKKSHIPLEFRTKERNPVRRNRDGAKPTPICLCPYCGKKSANIAVHQTHLRTHTGEKPYECPTCNKRFTCQQTLKPHLRLHTGEKPFRCDICGAAFRQIPHLKGHKLIHSGVKKHKCQYCGKAFALRGNLTVHRRLHTGEKPYECNVCNKRFYDLNGMKRHKSSHAKNGEMPNQKDEVQIQNGRIENIVNLNEFDVCLDDFDLENEYTKMVEAEILNEWTS